MVESGSALLKPRAPEASGSERRRDVRMTSVFQIAKIITARAEELCILRDVSPEGLKAEVYCAMTSGEAVTIEFRTGHAIAGRVAWARDSYVGVQFDELMSVVSVLSHSSFDERVGRIRPPRLKLEVAGRLRTLDHDVEIETCDVSQAGMKLLVEGVSFRPDTPCHVTLPKLDQRKGLIRWCRNGSAGLMFTEALSYHDFAAWRQRLSRLQG